MIFSSLAKIRGALWVVIQLLTFWNSYKKGQEGPDDDLANTGADQKEEEKKGTALDD